MKKKLLIITMMLSLSFLTACNLYETDKANKFVDEANKAIPEANSSLEKGNAKLVEMENAIPKIESEEELESQRKVAKETIPLLEVARDKYKEASGKFEEASKLKLQDKFKEYLDTKSKEMKKRSEIADVMIGEPKALINTNSKDDYQKAVQEIVAKFKALKTEADDLAAKADKITQENKEIFKTPAN
jgi:hypothetical protein